MECIEWISLQFVEIIFKFIFLCLFCWVCMFAAFIATFVNQFTKSKVFLDVDEKLEDWSYALGHHASLL